MLPPEIFSIQDRRTIIYMVSRIFSFFYKLLLYDINVPMNYEGLFEKIWWWKEQLCINYLVSFIGNIALRKSLICQYQRDIRFREQMLYRKSMPYDMVWTTAYKVIIKNVNDLMVIQYKMELGFSFFLSKALLLE